MNLLSLNEIGEDVCDPEEAARILAVVAYNDDEFSAPFRPQAYSL